MAAITTWTLSPKHNSVKFSPFYYRSQNLSPCHSLISQFKFSAFCWGKLLLNFKDSIDFSASSSLRHQWLEVEATTPKVYEDEEFVVVSFYHFVSIEDPENEVSKHLAFMQGLDIRGRIYVNEQGINAQYSGPSKDALAYVSWLRKDHRFCDILVQLSPASNGHTFPKLNLRYKRSLVQTAEGMTSLPLLDPSMRASPLMPSQWRSKMEAVNMINKSSDTNKTNCILLDVRNGYEWDIGHFKGALRPDVDCFRNTTFGVSESKEPYLGPLQDVDKENSEILMYCTGGIRCDVYSTILRQQGFKKLYTLKGGISHYFENVGSVGWVENLFVFDGRLSLPPPMCKPEVRAKARGKEVVSHSFAKCYICDTLVSELRHRNCANLDCNILFLCCLKCVSDFSGCCCTKCTSAPRLRPVLPGHRRYQKWHNYRDLNSQGR